MQKKITLICKTINENPINLLINVKIIVIITDLNKTIYLKTPIIEKE